MENNYRESENSKNVVVYVLVAFILALSLAVGGGAYYIGYHTGTDDYIKSSYDFTLGSINARSVYKNEFLQMQFKLPEDMEIDINFLQDFNKNSTVTVFDATVPNTDESVSLSFTNLKKIYMGQRKTGEVYAEQLRKAVVGGVEELKDVDLNSELETVNIGGRDFYKVYEYTNKDGYNKAMFVQRIEEYICTVDITTKGKVADRLAAFSPLEKF